MSLSDDKSLLRYFNFLARTQVEKLGQWRPILTAAVE